jgi:hypothetical protein
MLIAIPYSGYETSIYRGTMSIQQGQFVEVRGRSWLVEAVDDTQPDLTTLKLSCIADDAQGEQIEVLWDAEIGTRIIQDLRRVSTVGYWPFDGRRRCGAGRGCDRFGRMKAGTPSDDRRQRGSVTGLAGLGSPGLRSAASTDNVTYAVHPSSRFLASNS